VMCGACSAKSRGRWPRSSSRPPSRTSCRRRCNSAGGLLRSFGPTGSDSSRDSAVGVGLCRVDLHAHTRHSVTGHLRMPRLRRGLPEPEALYRAARTRGMDLVTFTDLDSIGGCLEFLDRHPDAPDFFMSEEVRAIEPRTRAVVSVLVHDLTE